MKKLFILPLLLASFIVTACVEDDSIVKSGRTAEHHTLSVTIGRETSRPEQDPPLFFFQDRKEPSFRRNNRLALSDKCGRTG